MKRITLVILMSILSFIPNAHPLPLFFDDFNAGAKSEWGNELGNWTANNYYYAQSPSGDPGESLTYSSVSSLPGLTDFSVNIDINNVSDGGVWLRSLDNRNGILFVTRLDQVYWHIFENGVNVGSYNVSHFNGPDNVSYKIDVIGDTYNAFLNGAITPVTSFTSDKFSSGKVALYSNSNQTFDNFSISDFNETSAIPEPSTIFLLSFGIAGISWKKRKRFW